jgi:hypothetical protein
MNWSGIAVVAGVCFLKLIITGIPAAVVAELTFTETFIAASVGGVLGITFFVFLIEALMALFDRLFPRKKKKNPFTKRNRLIILGKQKFGLTGIAFLTPFIFSMPLGAFLAVRFFRDRYKILRYMYVSIIAWSLIGAWLAEPIKEFLDWINELI